MDRQFVLCPVGARLHFFGSLSTVGFSNEDADALARKRLGTSFLSPKLAIYVSSCVGRLEIKESLTKKHPEY
jgi:hypothetical protein